MTSPRLSTAISDRYRIERELGAGGMATVYLATDVKHERQVALKVLRPELGAVLGAERFLAEIKITARLDHPHILTLIDSGAADGLLYYVLPYVRGESLRDKLNREKQLGMEEALAITKQVASALDYAHRQGVVHRDIKPENILLQEGEAMLADFGIALAVKEAGGNRLTETGLSLGTPQYMSPEQATGDRMLDARSDVYSLAAVLYEMLAGEPPVTGPTAQAMIAKLMMERPTHLKVVRGSVPDHVDAAVAKALDKTPADRFASAGEFARALEIRTGPVTAATPAAAPRSRAMAIGGALAGVAVLAAAGLLLKGRTGRHEVPATLGPKVQLTTTGNVLAPAVSPDGKQLAYYTRHCGSSGCAYDIVVQDVGGTTTRTILAGATSVYGLVWSPDRRNLMAITTVGGRWGSWLVSALGGQPRFLGGLPADFWAGGDSLLLGQPFRSDSVFYVRVASLDGVVHDSIRVEGPGQNLASVSNVPGTRWIVVMILQAPHGLWKVIGRDGRVASQVLNACTCGGTMAGDALWLSRAGDNPGGEAIVRIALDSASGKLGSRQDTMFLGLFTGFTVTADGGSFVMDEGTNDFGVWVLETADLFHGRFPEARRLLRSSTPIGAGISPDGSRLLIRRVVATAAGRAESRYSAMPFGGGAETPLTAIGSARRAFWTDSVTVAFAAPTPAGLRLTLLDVRTGATGRTLDLPDSVVGDFDVLPDGWAWIPISGDRVVVEQGGRRREFRMPAWYSNLFQVATDGSGRRVGVAGWNASTNDSIGVSVISLDDGTVSQWGSGFAEGGGMDLLDDGGAVLTLRPTQESAVFYRLRGPGQMERVGATSRAVSGINLSHDLRRAAVMVRDYHADAWMSRVVRP